MLDVHLADIYGVTRMALNQAVKRNLERFPVDFAFQLNASETAHLRSQFAPSSPLHTPQIHPWVLTDRGALMAAKVLHSEQAIQVSIHVVRASVRLRKLIAEDGGLAKLLDELERRVLHHDQTIADIVNTLRELATPPNPKSKRRIGLISGD